MGPVASQGRGRAVVFLGTSQCWLWEQNLSTLRSSHPQYRCPTSLRALPVPGHLPATVPSTWQDTGDTRW